MKRIWKFQKVLNPNLFYPTALKGCRGILFTHGVGMVVRAGSGKKFVLVCETVRCRQLILGRDIGWGCRGETSWRDLKLTFELAVVTLSYKILSGLCLGN